MKVSNIWVKLKSNIHKPYKINIYEYFEIIMEVLIFHKITIYVHDIEMNIIKLLIYVNVWVSTTKKYVKICKTSMRPVLFGMSYLTSKSW